MQQMFPVGPNRLMAVGLALGLMLSQLSSPASAEDQRLGDPEIQSKAMNVNTVTIVSGGINGTYLRLASDLSTVLDDGKNLRILPMIGKGSVQNTKDVLFLKGVDLGLVSADSLEALRREGQIGADKQLTYIARLTNDEMHVITTRDITDVRQLASRKVNFDVVGSGSYFSSTVVFEKLGIQVEPTGFEQADAYEKLKKGEIAASVFWGGKPVRGLSSFENDGRFHLLAVPFDPKLGDTYLPAQLTKEDYPNLITGDGIETVAVGTLLVSYNWRENTRRYKKVAKFVDAFFGKFDQLLVPPRHPKWNEVNIGATVPGWRRFKAAQEWLDNDATILDRNGTPDPAQ
jgi:uncharacterized protein